MTETTALLEDLNADRRRQAAEVELRDLVDLERWDAQPGAPAITHESGRFFSVRGLRPAEGGRPQPVMLQPEIGVLGILAVRRCGELHLLMQHKMEPGNLSGVQISPTIQATRSNQLGVHGGAPVPYLDELLGGQDGRGRRVLIDTLQTEQSTLVSGKRNRNLVVELDREPPVMSGWRWYRRSDLLSLLAVDDVVSMEARSVLACLCPQLSLRSGGSRHSMTEVLSAIAAERSGRPAESSALIPLTDLNDWEHTERALTAHGQGFSVIGASVHSSSREVASWDQPMIAAGREGLIGLFTTCISGAPHVLMRLGSEPGGFDTAELGPTVQSEPQLSLAWTAAQRQRAELLLPDLLTEVHRVFDAMASDEGGRFYHTSMRHLIVEVDEEVEPPGFLWLSLDQCVELLRFGGFFSCRARSILAALYSVLERLTKE